MREDDAPPTGSAPPREPVDPFTDPVYQILRVFWYMSIFAFVITMYRAAVGELSLWAPWGALTVFLAVGWMRNERREQLQSPPD